MPLPVGHRGDVSDTRKFPPGWIVAALPSAWDPEAADDVEVEIPTVQVAGYVTLPRRFDLFVQTPDMKTEDEPTTIVASFMADTQSIELLRISGSGPWVAFLGEVVVAFPPSEWTDYAEAQMVDFLRFMAKGESPLDDSRRQLTELVRELPFETSEGATGRTPAETGTQRRRKITTAHLAEVAAVYEEAQKDGEPPTRAVQYHFDVSHSTAAKWVGKARSEGLLSALDQRATA